MITPSRNKKAARWKQKSRLEGGFFAVGSTG